MKKLLSNKWVETGFLLLLIVSAVLSIYTPEIEFIQQSTQHAVLIMYGFLAVGFIFLIFDQYKLLFVSLGCCAAMCIFLKNASNTRLILPELNLEPKISIAHINLANINSIEDLSKIIDDHDPDVISLQELTPDWDQAVRSVLTAKYPYVNSKVRIDVYGMAVFSKLAMMKTDTFMYKNIPNLVCTIKSGDRKINILSSYLLSLNKSAETNTREHFATIERKLKTLEGSPTFSIGDFNMVYWQSEILNFRDKANLENSRRDYREVGFKLPMDHILFTKDLECTQFLELSDAAANHIGIMGVYQLKSSIKKGQDERILVG